MRKIINVIVPLIFILLGIGCLTLSSTVFHKHNSLHYLLESFIGICIFLVVPVVFGIIYFWFKKKKKRKRNPLEN